MPEKKSQDSEAEILAALGHPTRLAMVRRLASVEKFAGLSITELAEGTGLTRQAVTKHLEALTEAGLVIRRHPGRETWYELKLAPLHAAIEALSMMASERARSQRELESYKEKVLGKST